MDFSKLSMGAKLALIGGAVLVINLFLPWYSFSEFGFGSISFNAFRAGFLAWAGSFIAIAGAAIVLLKATGRSDVKAGQFKAEQLALIAGALGTVLILIKVFTGLTYLGVSVDGGRSFGLFLGLAAAAAVTVGAYMAMKDAGLDMPGMGGGGSGNTGM